MTEQAPASNAEAQTPQPASLPTQEERDRASAEKYRNQLDGQVAPLAEESAEAPAKTARPDNVPEKFWDAEKGEIRVDEVLKAHSELEKKLSQKPVAPKAKEGAGTGTGENAEGEQTDDGETPDPVAEAVKGFAALRERATAKLAAGEELDDEMYQGMEKHGLSREDVDTYIAGQQAIGTLAKMEVHNAVGGEDSYKAMIEWARSNFEEKEIEVYDRDIHSGDPAVRLTAAKGLAARYAQAMGNDGVSVTDGKHGNRGLDGYASGAEMRMEMRDPRYQTDAAFRENVARKAAAARKAGIDLSL